MTVDQQPLNRPVSIDNQELNILLDISRIINSTRDTCNILDDLQSYLARLIPFTYACYYVKKGSSFVARYVIGSGPETAADLNRHVANNFLLERIMVTRRACKSTQLMSAAEIKEHPYYKGVLSKYNSPICAGVPVLVANIVMGGLTMARIEDYGDFSHREMQLLEIVANGLASSVNGIDRDVISIQRSGENQVFKKPEEDVPKQVGFYRSVEALASTFALVTNELRGPLANMKVALESLKLNRTGNMAPDLEHMEKSILRMDNIVKGLQNFTSEVHISDTMININELLDETLHMLAPAMDPEVIVEKDYAQDLILYADGEKLNQAFINVIENALEAMPGGGMLRIITAVREGYAYVIIEDNGLGVERDIRPKLFEPFVSSKVHGMGMGLPVARRIIESHGGEIKVKSTIGKGTAVWIGIPVIASNMDS